MEKDRKEAIIMTQPDEETLVQSERPDERLDPEVRDFEAPTADAAEQAMPVNSAEATTTKRTIAFEANEYDALEQDRVVDLADDDYR
jgi:hypothetical protein